MDSLTEKTIFELLKSKSPAASCEHSKHLWKKVYAVRHLFNSLPFVKEVAICNSLSFDLVDENSDIDLFFILDSNRFFMARFFISVLFEFFGQRRKKNLIAERFCLSFYVDEKNMNFSKIAISNNDYYLQYWFKSLIFLRGNKFLQTQLISENRNFLSLSCFKNETIIQKNWLAKLLESVFRLSVFDTLELLLKSVQIKRALSKNSSLNNPSGVIIRPGLLKFHVLDARKDFNKKVYFSLFK